MKKIVSAFLAVIVLSTTNFRERTLVVDNPKLLLDTAREIVNPPDVPVPTLIYTNILS